MSVKEAIILGNKRQKLATGLYPECSKLYEASILVAASFPLSNISTNSENGY